MLFILRVLAYRRADITKRVLKFFERDVSRAFADVREGMKVMFSDTYEVQRGGLIKTINPGIPGSELHSQKSVLTTFPSRCGVIPRRNYMSL